MALPPIGDPRRPLQLAIRSSRVLGILLTLLGLLVLAVTAPRSRFLSPVLAILAGLFYLVPGILYIICSIFLGKRQACAIIVTMVLAGISEIGAIAVLVPTVLAANVLGIAIAVLAVAAFAQLLFHLSKSFESIRADAEYAPRGFEPLPPVINQSQPPRL